MKLTTRQKVGICLVALTAAWVLNNPLAIIAGLILNLPFILGPLGLYLILADYTPGRKKK